jgi:hypothetical protein
MSDIINNSTQGPNQNSFIPSITSGQLLRSDGLLWKKIFRQADEQDFLMFIESIQAWKLADDVGVRWHEEGYVMANATIASFTGGASAGAAAVITLPASAHQNSGTRSPFKENNILKVDGTQMFVVSKNTTTPNAHTITVTPLPTTVTLNTVLAAGKTIIISGSAYGEQTGYTEGMMNLPIKFEEQTGIVKTKITTSGTLASNVMKVPGALSGSDRFLYEADMKCFLQHKSEVSLAALIGPGGTTTDAAGKTVQVVKGAITQVLERGNDYGYNGSLTYNDIQNLTRILIKQRAGNEHLMNVGHEADLMIEQFVSDSMRNGARIYLDNQNGTLKGQKLVDFGCDGFRLSNFTFVKKRMSEFNNPVSLYAPGQEYPYYVWTTPIANTKDPVSGQAGYALQFAYKGIQGPKGMNFDRKFYAPTPGGDGRTSEIDEVNFRYLTEFAPLLALANQSVIMRKLS